MLNEHIKQNQLIAVKRSNSSESKRLPNNAKKNLASLDLIDVFIFNSFLNVPDFVNCIKFTS